MILEIVLKGGPGGGKSETLEYVSEKLTAMGHRVFIIHEVPTQFIYPGLPDINEIALTNYPLYLEIQRLMIKDHAQRRSVIKELALKLTDKPIIIIHDRASMDFCSYMDEASFSKSISDLGLTPYDVCESYDGVVHMVTAAYGAERHYTTKNNKAPTTLQPYHNYNNCRFP